MAVRRAGRRLPTHCLAYRHACTEFFVHIGYHFAQLYKRCLFLSYRIVWVKKLTVICKKNCSCVSYEKCRKIVSYESWWKILVLTTTKTIGGWKKLLFLLHHGVYLADHSVMQCWMMNGLLKKYTVRMFYLCCTKYKCNALSRCHNEVPMRF